MVVFEIARCKSVNVLTNNYERFWLSLIPHPFLAVQSRLFVPTIPGAFGIVYKGLLMDWNNVAMRGVALKTLKGS